MLRGLRHKRALCVEAGSQDGEAPTCGMFKTSKLSGPAYILMSMAHREVMV